MHNQRNRRAAKPKALKIKTARTTPAFPAEVKIPPHRGAVAVGISAPLVSGIALFALPVQPKIKPAAKRRKPRRKARALGKAPQRRPKLVAALPLPQSAEPLVEPLPRNRSLAPLRASGLLARINDWLGQSARGLWDRLGGVPTARPAPRRKKASAQELELIRLRAENARLKRQLDALLARDSASLSPIRHPELVSGPISPPNPKR